MIRKAICGVTAFAVFSTAAAASTTSVPVAHGADASTLATMQSQCDALASAHGINWSAVAVEGAATYVSGPTEIGVRDIDLSSVVGTGPFTWGGITIEGDPFRNGGSVNMFGNQRATEQNFASSTYDYTADFTSIFSYASTCEMTETVQIPASGHHEWQGPPQAADRQRACLAADNNVHATTDQGQCVWVEDSPGSEEDVPRPPEPGAPILQEQTDNFPGHEANGGPVTLSGDLFVGNPVICISPKKLPGVWANHNGYTGDKCTTAWFNDPAILRNGSTTSNGTYISVPAF